MLVSRIPLRSSHARGEIERVQLRLALHLLACGNDVIIEWGTWSVEERCTIAIIAQLHGYPIHAHFLLTPLRRILKRVKRRNATVPSDHQMTADEILSAYSRWQPPIESELTFYTNVTYYGERRAG